MRTGDHLQHPGLRDLATSPAACPALIAGNFDLPQLRALNVELVVPSSGDHEMFTSPRSILNRPPSGLAELILCGRISIDLLAACGAVPQLKRLHLILTGSSTPAALADHASAFRGLETLALECHAKTPIEEVVALKANLEGALPDTRLEIRWDHLVRRDPNAASLLPDSVDAASRNREGRVDALARWISGERT